MKNKFVMLLLPLAISGCISLDPELKQNKGIVPDSLPNHGIYEKTVTDTVNHEELHWNNYVTNEKMKNVINLSLANNKDLRIALANINAAKAQYGISKADRLPSVNAGISGSKGRTINGMSESYQADFGISSFELDLFGRVQSLTTSALESFLATQEAQRTTELTVISETAKLYYNVALAKSQLQIAQKTELTTYESWNVINKRVQVGVANSKDLSDVESTYYKAKSDVYAYKTQLEQSINALNALVGQSVQADLLPTGVTELDDSVKDITIAVSSDVLYQRPDVLSIEHQLKAANANIGAARAAFFPRITLTTSKGIASSELSSLFRNNIDVWNFSPSLSLPIFDYGRNKASLEYSKAQLDKYVATYEQTVQNAFKEVSDELARKGTIDDQLNAYSKFVNATKNSYEIATKSYDAGVSDYLQVLTAQNSLYDAERSILAINKEKFDNKINLYKVIGY
jgi:multidrug efflux system outer membrane protein